MDHSKVTEPIPQTVIYYIRKVPAPSIGEEILPFDFKLFPRKQLSLSDPGELQDEMKGAEIRMFKERLRPQQAFFFSVIEDAVQAVPKEGIAYFCLDLPLFLEGRGYQLVRYFHLFEADQLRIFILNNETLYQGEPFYPRIGVEKEGSWAEKEFSADWRRAILEEYDRRRKSRKPPFGGRPTELLTIYQDNPEIEPYQIAKKMGIAVNTIANHRKTIGTKIKDFFGVSLPDYGLTAAQYWTEMGLSLPIVKRK